MGGFKHQERDRRGVTGVRARAAGNNRWEQTKKRTESPKQNV